MAYEWDSSLETGNEVIDTQHKQLFAALNNLVAAHEGGKGPEELEKTLDFLAAYTVQHFHDEEQLQKEYCYPDYMIHKSYHSEFKKVVGDLVAHIKQEGYTPALLDTTIKTVADWVVHHIKSDDFRLAAHIFAVNKGKMS